MTAQFNKKSVELSFLLSALTKENQFHESRDFISWFDSIRTSNRFSVKQIPFGLLEQWYFEEPSGNLVHASGKFFKIEGISVSTNFGRVKQCDQPIINQPEIGILGIITKNFDGLRYFLMQAKMEPGNVNIIQLSPTVQATKSNYNRVHKGKLPAYLEYFLDRDKSRVLVDQLQSEQGGRFLKKRNRNMIVEVKEDIPVHENFCWLTLGEIKHLHKIDNFVNMDARSVLACIPFFPVKSRIESELLIEWWKNNISNTVPLGFSQDILDSMIDDENAYCTEDAIIGWLTELKTKYYLNVRRIALNKVAGWKRTDKEIMHATNRFFSVIAVLVHANNREISHWTQPLLKSKSNGLLGFISKKINNVLHFLVQAKVEPGNFDIIDLAPTVSCSEIASKPQKDLQPPFVEFFMDASPEEIRYSAFQSEEGGRFYHFQNRNMIIELNSAKSLALPENYIWMTLNQILSLLRHGYFNIESRSLLSALSFI